MRILLTICFCIASFISTAQESNYRDALSRGDIELLSNYLAEQIDLNISKSKGIYSKQQSKLILKKFFDANPGLQYVVKHEGGAKARSKFEIGELVKEGVKFRTYLLYNTGEEGIEIIEFRIEQED